jgi:hypothetical protein
MQVIEALFTRIEEPHDYLHIKHRKMEMTLIYARITNRVVADEYAAVSAKIDALYGQQLELPADYETAGMARLRREAHARVLGNGCAPAQSNSTAGWNPPVKPAPTSAPACSSCPPSPSNATTPANTDKPNVLSFSIDSSSAWKPIPTRTKVTHL